MKGSGRGAIPGDLEILFRVGAIGQFTDGELLDRFVERKEADAFEALMHRHGPMVWGVCRRVLRDGHDAEDAFQATFLVLARKAASVRPREKLVNWLYGVACRTAGKARAVRDKRRGRGAHVSDLTELIAVPDEPRNVLTDDLDQELARLPEKFRIPIILCELEGKSHAEAAMQLGWPVGTLSSRLSRGRQKLRSRLCRNGLAPESGGAMPPFVLGLEAELLRRLVSATSRMVSVPSFRRPWSIAFSADVSLTGKVLRAMSLTKLSGLAGLVLIGSLFARTTFNSGPATGDRADLSPVRPTSLVVGQPILEGIAGELPSALTRPRPWETAARVKVHYEDASPPTVAFSSGVIVCSDEANSLLITCAHNFRNREAARVLPGSFAYDIRVDLFDGKLTGSKPAGVKAVETHAGELIAVDFDSDLALVRIRPGRRLSASPIAQADSPVEHGESLVSVGCSEGNDATVWTTTVLAPLVRGVSGNPRYEAIACSIAPKQGRSGGGLFSLEGEVVGVCNYADPKERGLYAPAAAVHRLLAQSGEASRKAPAGPVPPRAKAEPEPLTGDGNQIKLEHRLSEVERKLDRIIKALEVRPPLLNLPK